MANNKKQKKKKSNPTRKNTLHYIREPGKICRQFIEYHIKACRFISKNESKAKKKKNIFGTVARRKVTLALALKYQ